MAQALTTEERSNLLQREIQKYVKDGWRVQSSTATTAQLVKPKKFSFLTAFLYTFSRIYLRTLRFIMR